MSARYYNEISNTLLSHQSGPLNFDNISQKVDAGEKEGLKRKEVNIVLLDIKDEFKRIMSSAYRWAFRFMSLRMLIGILSAFFCEKSEKSQVSDSPVVNAAKED